jgi:type II secretory pathway component GspD/PulD (secretin)
MKLQLGITHRNLLCSLALFATLTVALRAAHAQTPSSSDNKAAEVKPDEAKPVHPKPDTYETFYLANSPQQNDLNDMQTMLRNMLPWARIYGLPSQHAIVVFATKEDVATARMLLASADKKKSVYRLTYTMTEANGDKRHYSLVASSGERATIKLGDRVPIVTGKSDADSANASTQVQYIDLGLNIDATLDTAADSLRLRTKFEQSSLAEAKSGMSLQDPIIHQTTLDSNAALIPGKALVLGSLEIAGSSHPVEVEVIAELVK